MPTPSVFPALAVIAGIAIGILFPAPQSPVAALLVGACAGAFGAWRKGRERLFLVCLLLGFAIAGVLLGSAELAKARRPPLREFFDDARENSAGGLPPLVVEGVIRQDAAPTGYGASMTLDVLRVQTTCGWIPASGGLRLALTGAAASERIEDWRAGRTVRVPVVLRLPAPFRDPGVADETFTMMRRGIALAGTAKSGMLVEITRRGHPLAELGGSIRAYARRAIAGAIPDRPVAAAIVTAILVGDRGALDAQLERRLQEAGTYHVIAISGGNVAILAALAFLLLRLARVPARTGSLALACLICGYGYVAGGGASVARATLAAAVYLVARAADHRSPALNVLATVALMAIVYAPLDVFDPGLLLSYGATLALLIASEHEFRSRRGGKRDAEPQGVERAGTPLRPVLTALLTSCISALRRLGLCSVVAAARAVFVGTVAAELAILPVGAFVFHRITVAGFLLNFAAIPLMTVAQMGGLAVLLLTPVSATLAHVAGHAAGFAADGLTRSTAMLDVAPWATWRVPAPPLESVILYYAGWLALLMARSRGLRAGAGAVTTVAALSIAWPALTDWLFVHRSPAEGQLRVTFLDVGQGDSTVVQFPGSITMLVDAAGLPRSSFDLTERVITPAMLALGVRRLEYLAITHGDPDHVEGAPGVARDFRPREVWEGVPVPPHQTLRDLRTIVERGGGVTRLVRPDDRLHVGSVEVRVLHPAEPDWERQRVRNDDSIVLELRYGDVSIVLPGDIGAPIEESLAGTLSDAPIRVLKAAHHGSATSSGDAWLAAARPAAVIFSAGRDNRYGHPAPPVLARVAAHGAAIFRTDQDGAITVTTDGKTATVFTFTGRRSHFTVHHEVHEGHEASTQ